MPLSGVVGQVDWRLLGRLSQLSIDGFITGALGEQLLFPLGNRMTLEHLILIGAGRRSELSRESFKVGIQQMFTSAKQLNCTQLTTALPGRPENLLDAHDAIQWFLDIYQRLEDKFYVTIIDTYEVHPIFQEEMEKRRMKASVTPPPTS